MRISLAEFKKYLVLSTSGLAITATLSGVYFAVHSSLFLLTNIEVAELGHNPPLDAQTLIDSAALPLGELNLFDLDLPKIEGRILAQTWVKQVELHKVFPRTLSIHVTFRKPVALLQSERGPLLYLDPEGSVFGPVSLQNTSDYALVSGIRSTDRGRVLEALQILAEWKSSPLSRIAEISSLGYDTDHGYRAWIAYPLSPSINQRGAARLGLGRSLIELGHDLDAEIGYSLGHLRQVVQYLASHGISARQIWADAGKKIVVKIAHGS